MAIVKERMTTAPLGLRHRRQNFEAQAKVNRFRGVGSLCPKHWLVILMAKGLVPTRATTPQLRAGPVMSRSPRPNHLRPSLLNLKERLTPGGGGGVGTAESSRNGSVVVVEQHRVCVINMRKGPKAQGATKS